MKRKLTALSVEKRERDMGIKLVGNNEVKYRLQRIKNILGKGKKVRSKDFSSGPLLDVLAPDKLAPSAQ